MKKYIGLDVHKDATSIAVLNGVGKLVMESIIETKAATLLEFLHGLRGELHVTLEEGTWAAWLYDVLKPHVEEIVVCMRGSWPSCCAPDCCARSTTEKTDYGRCGSWRVAI
jgi:hypothetical protein